ncbi:MAG: ATP-binding cassette domain-containing protein [Neisseria sp.]|nr:ATP-binding cassette domain-containing protein [Neisseria sp.]
MLSVSKLDCSIMGDDIVRGFDLTLEAGRAACLYGPSGCGKTTILRILAGLADYQSGRICNGFARTVYLFQEHRLLPWRTLWENVLLAAPRDPAAPQRARAILKRLYLAEADWRKYPHELSGGMRQRAAIARALVCRPDLLLLDEPFSALDYELKLKLYAWLGELLSEGLGIIMVSHDRFEALQTADTVYLLDHKPARCRQIVQLDTPRGLRDEAFVRRYLAQPFWQAYHE